MEKELGEVDRLLRRDKEIRQALEKVTCGMRKERSQQELRIKPASTVE